VRDNGHSAKAERPALAEHFNANGLTTRKGRRWTGETVAKFLSSSGAKRYRTGGNGRAHGEA
jgi:hypothetical protein